MVKSKDARDSKAELLKILNKRAFPTAPKSVSTFVNTRTCNAKIIPMLSSDKVSYGEYVYFGIQNSFKALEEVYYPHILEEDGIIYVQINIDDAPVTKSGKHCNIRPLSARIHKHPEYAAFPIAIYCGPFKPASNEEFLHDFIVEYNKLSTDGFIFHGKNYLLSIKCFVCDSLYRAENKNVKSHEGFFACKRC